MGCKRKLTLTRRSFLPAGTTSTFLSIATVAAISSVFARANLQTVFS
jgi:hypothetical protein